MLAGAGVLYIIHVLQARTQIHFLPIKLPLALFCLLSVVSVFGAANPTAGWFAVRKLVLFLIWLLAMNLIVSAQHVRRLLQGLFLVSSLASLVAIAQFVIQYRDVRAHHPGQVYYYLTLTRIHGFMGHWMHFGGQQMLVFAFLLGFLLLANDRNSKVEIGNSKLEIRNSGIEIGNLKSEIRNPKSETRRSVSEIGNSKLENRNSGGRISNFGFRVSNFEFRVSLFWCLVVALVALSIILNFTRGVWLGCCVEGIYLLARWRPKWLWALLVLAALAYVGAPSLVRERLHGAMHPTEDPALSIRLEMWRVALQMIRSHPWVGVGPNNIEEVYDLYLPPRKSPEVGYHSHFHNDYLQFGAERGLPCLAAWLWLMGALGWYTWKLRRSMCKDSPPDSGGVARQAPGWLPDSGAVARQRRGGYPMAWIADAALAAWLAFLVEGCFEFNFGTSPVLMMFLFVTSTPFIAARVAASGKETEGVTGEGF
jgi:hypothetical protein